MTRDRWKEIRDRNDRDYAALQRSTADESGAVETIKVHLKLLATAVGFVRAREGRDRIRKLPFGDVLDELDRYYANAAMRHRIAAEEAPPAVEPPAPDEELSGHEAYYSVLADKIVCKHCGKGWFEMAPKCPGAPKAATRTEPDMNWHERKSAATAWFGALERAEAKIEDEGRTNLDGQAIVVWEVHVGAYFHASGEARGPDVRAAVGIAQYRCHDIAMLMLAMWEADHAVPTPRKDGGA
jgi:hypothetical protein